MPRALRSDPAAVKRRESYRRNEAGRGCFPAELDKVEVVESLVATGHLRECDRDDPKKILAAWKAARPFMDVIVHIHPKSDGSETATPKSATKSEIGDLICDDHQSSTGE
jgi:hypothetical protein